MLVRRTNNNTWRKKEPNFQRLEVGISGIVAAKAEVDLCNASRGSKGRTGNSSWKINANKQKTTGSRKKFGTGTKLQRRTDSGLLHPSALGLDGDRQGATMESLGGRELQYRKHWYTQST